MVTNLIGRHHKALRLDGPGSKKREPMVFARELCERGGDGQDSCPRVYQSLIELRKAKVVTDGEASGDLCDG